MTDTAIDRQRVPLNVGDIIGNTFSIFFGRFGYIFPLALIPAFLIEVLKYLTLGAAAYGGDEIQVGAEIGAGSILLSVMLDMIGQTLATAFVILAAYDARLGRTGSFGHYASIISQSIVTAVVCSIFVGICVGLAAIALIVPGLWVYGVWCVVVPAIVIERAGFGGLARSAELTRGYRWPCVGTIFLINICMLVIVVVVVFVAALIIGFASLSAGLTGLVSTALANGFALGLSGVSIALIYARLREIKEGTSVEDIVEVFS